MGSRIGIGAPEVVCVDADFLVFNKPSGLLSVPGRGDDKQDCLSARAQVQFPDALIVHRLDMATSGLMVMARSPEVQRTLSNAFANREVTKHYVAVVDGLLEAKGDPDGDGWQVIDLPISVDWPNRPLRMIDPINGKPSVTRWQPLSESASGASDGEGKADLDRSTPFTRVMLAPVTGRSHQLRIHLAALGHPILGDALYAPPTVLNRASRLLLHASLLGFAHPKTGQTMEFILPLPF